MWIRLIVLLVCALSAAAQTVTITDTLRTVSNTTFNGQVTITSPYMTYSGVTYLPGSRTVSVSNGVFSVALIPNVGATPTNTYYRVTYLPRQAGAEAIAPWTEMWEVAASGPYTVAQVRVAAPITNASGSPLRDVTNAAGDIIYRTANGLARLPIGTAGQVLTVATGLPAWAASTGGEGGSMTYPGAGVAVSTGTAWGTSLTTGTSEGNLVAVGAGGTLPSLSAANLTSFPTLNQNTTGTAAGLSTPLVAASGGLGADASAFAGVVKMSGGVASTVTGTSTHCVLVSGSSAECGTGGGGTPQVNGVFAFTAVTTFDIEHNYDTKALVISFYDANDVLFYPNSLEHISVNTTRVTFSPAATGYAIVNRSGWSGDVLGEESTVPLNSGAGAQVLKTATNVVGRTLVAGANVTITQGEDIITIAATAGEGGGGLSTVETGDGLLGVGTLADPVRVDPALVPNFMTAAATVNDWGTIGAAACVEQTMTFSGTLTGDAVIPQWPAALPAGLTGLMRVSAINTLAIRLCNATGAGVAVANGFQFGAMILRSF